MELIFIIIYKLNAAQCRKPAWAFDDVRIISIYLLFVVYTILLKYAIIMTIDWTGLIS